MTPTRERPILATGWALHVPGLALDTLVPGGGSEPACTAQHAHQILGRKGLLNKEPATKLALCAVHRALKLRPGAPPPDGDPDPRTAVVVSSNLGNVGTVAKVVRTLRDGTLRDVSPLDAPNASSNGMASMIAIWFRWGGPNLMVCSGSTSGLDAVRLGMILLRSGRCDRAVIVGAEADDEMASALYAKHASTALRAGAAALVLESLDRCPARTAVLGRVRPGADAANAELVIGPDAQAPPGASVIDLTERVGDLYGCLGVAQVALAAALLASDSGVGRKEIVVICGDAADGWRSLPVARGGSRGECGWSLPIHKC